MFSRQCGAGRAPLSHLLGLAVVLGAALSGPPASAQLLRDEFNFLDPCLWATGQVGGSTVAATNQRIEITHPADASGETFFAGIGSTFLLSGDFDVQVDFELLEWSFANGVRVGLGTGAFAVERISFGGESDFPGEPTDSYLTHLLDDVQGITATSDLSGTLRAARVGDQLSGYYWDTSAGDWALIHTGPVSPDDTGIGLSSWSHDYAFADQQVKIAFDNFQVNSGQILYGPCVPEPGTLALFGVLALSGLGFAARRRRIFPSR